MVAGASPTTEAPAGPATRWVGFSTCEGEKSAHLFNSGWLAPFMGGRRPGRRGSESCPPSVSATGGAPTGPDRGAVSVLVGGSGGSISRWTCGGGVIG